MAGRIRVLDSATRTMQRLGYLKILCAIVNETETSNLTSLGKRLIERVTKRFKLTPPFDEQIRDYVKMRLTDRAYRDLRKTVLDGANSAQVASVATASAPGTRLSAICRLRNRLSRMLARSTR